MDSKYMQKLLNLITLVIIKDTQLWTVLTYCQKFRKKLSVLKEVWWRWFDSILTEISNTLATWCEELTLWKRAWCWERFEGRRRRGWQRMRRLDGIINSMDMSLSKFRELWWTGRPGVLQSMGLPRVGHDWATELNWMWRTNSLGKTLMLGKIEDRRRREWQRMGWLDGIIDAMDLNLSKLWEIVKDREA